MPERNLILYSLITSRRSKPTTILTEAGVAARRWLTALKPRSIEPNCGSLACRSRTFQPQRPEDMFHKGLLERTPRRHHVHQLSSGHHALERYHSDDDVDQQRESVTQTRWDPYIVKMRWTSNGESVRSSECPILETLKTGCPIGTSGVDQVVRRQAHCIFNLLTVPILDPERSRLGVAAMFRDATEEVNLQERVVTLHKKATIDPLTKLSNRAELDRFHAESIHRHETSNRPNSLIICDIDRFKSINDKYGHQAGDEALVSFAKLLERVCREGDLVARYGGEEFVMICENCTADEATKIAEKIRENLAVTPLKELGDQCITASFGVTELQPGDTMETMLRRADRGLLEAKDTGRNRVICLGSGMDKPSPDTDKVKSNWWSWIAPEIEEEDGIPITDCFLSTNVPVPIVSEKLRGFIADHNATILSADELQVVLKIKAGIALSNGRRLTEGAATFVMTIVFKEGDRESQRHAITIVHASLTCTGRRDRRSAQYDAARSLVKSLKSYLVAQYYEEDGGDAEYDAGQAPY